MRTLEKKLHMKGLKEGIGRDIINFAKDNNQNLYRFYVEMINQDGLGCKTYIYIPGEISEQDACRVILALMVEYFLGGDIDGTMQALIAEIRGDEPVKEEKKEEKPASKKTPRAKSKKSDEKPEDKKEEKEDKPKAKSKAKPKTISYDRNQTEHKKELAKVLNENFPEWHKDKELAGKAKEVSENLVGVALFDAQGEVLGTFTQNVLELMGENGSDEQVDL